MTRFLTHTAVGFILIFCQISMACAENAENEVQEKTKNIISYRGSADGLYEHNLTALTFAVLSGVKFIEQELVLTSDDQLIVFSDIYLDENTDVSVKFPERARENGRYYVIDFTLAEIQTLYLSGDEELTSLLFHIPTFSEELALIQKLERQTGKDVGIFPKLIKTWFHKKEGKDISALTLGVLHSYGYLSKVDGAYLQSYDTEELQRIKQTLLPMMQMETNLVQLLGNNDEEDMMLVEGNYISPYNFDWMFTNFGLRSLATYADIVRLGRYRLDSPNPPQLLLKYIEDVHTLGVDVYIEFNSDTALPVNNEQNALDALTTPSKPFMEEVETLLFDLKADGLVSDKAAQVQKLMDELSEKASQPSIHDLLPHLMQKENKQSNNKQNSTLSILKELQ